MGSNFGDDEKQQLQKKIKKEVFDNLEEERKGHS